MKQNVFAGLLRKHESLGFMEVTKRGQNLNRFFVLLLYMKVCKCTKTKLQQFLLLLQIHTKEKKT